MGTRGRVRLGSTCTCGHLFTRSETHPPPTPADLCHAVARTNARYWLGPHAPFAGIAIYQAVTENA